uniref:Pseudouridine synthase n=1 Tax=uncultured korarchaeote TaxID=161241 RepID=A0A1L2JMC9_9CREN|nr:pseudouridine synthase [uncultured korarchaeote]
MYLHGDVGYERLNEVIAKFHGDIFQRPPVRSSVKRKLRVRKIHKIDLLEYEDRYALIRVKCQAGTYIRKLIHDIGQVLLVGASMSELRRIAAGSFTENEAVTLQQLLQAYNTWRESGDEAPLRRIFRPMEYVLRKLPMIIIKDTAVDAICHGAPLTVRGISKLSPNIQPKDIVVIMTLKSEAVAIAEASMSSEEMLSSSRGIAAKPMRVLMDRGVYPPAWR